MPIYEYKCKNCGAVSEFLVGVNSSGQKLECKSCSSAELEKLISTYNVPTSTPSPAMPECSGCCHGAGQCGSQPACMQ